MNRKHKTILVAAIFAMQCLSIGWLVYRYERVVVNGTEFRLKCSAYDPADLLRGRYLRIQVTHENVPLPDADYDFFDSFREYKEPLYAKLEPRDDGSGIYSVTETSSTPGDQGLWVRPRSYYVRYSGVDTIHRVEDGVDIVEEVVTDVVRENESERYAALNFPDRLFVNEKTAPAAESILWDNPDNAVAVYRTLDHHVVLVDIEINGKSIRDAVKSKSE